MFERFTTAARDVVISAQHEREEFGHPFVGTEHLLLGLLNEGAGGAYAVLHRAGLTGSRCAKTSGNVLRQGPLGDADAEALQAIGIDLDEVRAKVEATFGPGALQVPAKPSRGFFQKPGSFSQRAKKVLELSLREAIRLHHGFIGPEHILLGLIREGDGLAAKIMVEHGDPPEDLRDQALGRAQDDARCVLKNAVMRAARVLAPPPRSGRSEDRLGQLDHHRRLVAGLVVVVDEAVPGVAYSLTSCGTPLRGQRPASRSAAPRSVRSRRPKLPTTGQAPSSSAWRVLGDGAVVGAHRPEAVVGCEQQREAAAHAEADDPDLAGALRPVGQPRADGLGVVEHPALAAADVLNRAA